MSSSSSSSGEHFDDDDFDDDETTENKMLVRALAVVSAFVVIATASLYKADALGGGIFANRARGIT